MRVNLYKQEKFNNNPNQMNNSKDGNLMEVL